MSYTGSEFVWAAEDARYVRSRPQRYPGALGIAPEWTQEVLRDDFLLVLEPYPSSRIGATGFVGWSASASRVLVVIAYKDGHGQLHGLNAWPASGRDLATYLEGVSDGETSE
jgi:hypothetical protein